VLITVVGDSGFAKPPAWNGMERLSGKLRGSGEWMVARFSRTLVALLVGVTVGLVVLPSSAYASAPNPQDAQLSAFMINGEITSPQRFNWSVGDCTLLGFWNGRVELDPPDSRGNSILHWYAAANTSHTNNADVWWGTFTFLTAHGTPIGTSHRLPGAQMTVVGETYHWTKVDDVQLLDPEFYPLISQVRWHAEC
jgi:hypothetical protein